MREGWGEATLGDVFELTSTRLGDVDVEPAVFSVTKYDGFVLASQYFDKRIASDNLGTYKVVEPGEWAYSTIHIDEGSIARNRHGIRGVVSPMYTTMRVREDAPVMPYFVELVARSPHMLAAYRDNAQGSINRRRSLPWKVFQAMPISLPPLREQQRIVDLICAVDDAVERAEAAHAAALELRTSTLHRMELLSLSGGVGITTLGDVLAMGGGSIQTGPFGTLLKAAEYVPEGVPVISTGEVRAGELVLKEGTPRVGRAVLSRLPQYVLREGDIVFARKGAIDRSAPVRAHEDGYFLGSDGMRVRVGEGPSRPAFVALQLQTGSALRWIELNATGTIMKGLNQRVLSSIPLGLLPLEKQLEFVEAVSAIDTVRRSASDSSDRLRALRANLLTALLSGEHEIPEPYDELMEPLP